MATIKTIKNNYEQLTKLERFGLYQKASLRYDENELAAIHAATPKKKYDVIDFYFLREEIYRVDTVNLLSRLGHAAMVDIFIRFSVQEKTEKQSELMIKSAKMSSYLYVIETDAWTTICDELGLEVNWFRKLSAKISFAVEMMENQDGFMRDLALSENEAQKFVNESRKNLKVKEFYNVKTLDEQIKFYRDFIEEI